MLTPRINEVAILLLASCLAIASCEKPHGSSASPEAAEPSTDETATQQELPADSSPLGRPETQPPKPSPESDEQACGLAVEKQDQNALTHCSEYDLVCERDARDNIVRMEVELDGDKTADEIRVMTYDSCGNLRLKEITKVDGSPITSLESGVSGTPLRTSYEYDGVGNFILETVQYGATTDRKTRWSFNDAGQATSQVTDNNGDGKDDMQWSYETGVEGQPRKRTCKNLTKRGKCPKS